MQVMRKIRFAVFSVLIAILLGVHSQSRATSVGRVVFLNVGQGDATLLQDGAGFDVIIDGGKSAAGPAILDFLRQNQIADLDVMVATHPDSDHIGGLITILQAEDILVKHLVVNGYPGDTATWNTFTQAAAADQLVLETVNFPMELSWGLMTVYVLNPASNLVNPDSNDASLVFRVELNQVGYLLTADIDSTIEATIIARQTPVAAEVLKVGHHGSAYSTSGDFLAEVQPDYGVISVGANPYGHPTDVTLERLYQAGVKIWRTDQAGHIIFETSDFSYSIIPQFRRSLLPSLLFLGQETP